MTRDEYDSIISVAFQIHKDSPYADLWKHFSVEELMGQAAYKAKRGSLVEVPKSHLLVETPPYKAKDDALDAINMLVFALAKMRSQGWFPRWKLVRRE